MGATNVGKAIAANLFIGSGTAPSYVAVGTGTTAAAVTDTALGTEVTDSGLERASATCTRVTTTVANDTSQFYKQWTASGAKTLGEVGVFVASSAGDMVARTVLSPTKAPGVGDTYTLTYKIAFA